MVNWFNKNIWVPWKVVLDKEKPPVHRVRRPEVYYYLTTILFLVALILPFLAVFFFSNVLEPLISMMIKNFGILSIGNFFGVLAFCFIFFAFIWASKILVGIISKDKQNWRTFIVLAVTTTVFLSGFAFIDGIKGAPNNQWKLYNESGKVYGILKCGNIESKLISLERTTCFIFKPTNSRLLNSSLIIEFKNYSNISLNSLDFLAPEDIYHLSFKLNVEDSNGIVQNVTTGFYPQFETREQNNQRENDFLTYFLGLLFVCLFTIPPLIIK